MEQSPENKINETPPQTLSEYLKERFGENVPKISLRFFASSHKTEMDADGIKEKMDEADIIIPEFSGWSVGTLYNINRASQGELPPLKNEKREFFRAIVNYLHNTKKPVIFIDMPKKEREELEKEIPYSRLRDDSTFEEALGKINESLKNEAETIYKKREQYMFSAIGPKIEEVLETHPELLKKEKITVLLTLGVAHTDMIKQLNKDPNTDVSKFLRYSPELFNPLSQVSRMHMFGKNVPEELQKKALLQKLLYYTSLNEYFEKSQNTNVYDRFEHFLVGLFPENEIRFLFEEWKKSSRIKKNDEHDFLNTKNGREYNIGMRSESKIQKFISNFRAWREKEGRTENDFDVLFQKHLAEKGVNIPKNDRDALEIMKRYKHDKQRTT
jgi:hypothetical protein